MSDWMSIKDTPIDMDRIHLLVDGDSIYIRGTRLQPFFYQLCGSYGLLMDLNWTHWMPLPHPPEKEE